MKLQRKQITLLGIVCCYILSILTFTLSIGTTPVVYAAAKNDKQLSDYADQRGLCGDYGGDKDKCINAFKDVYKNRKQVAQAGDKFDSRTGGLAERYCTSKGLTAPGLSICVNKVLSQAFQVSKDDKVGSSPNASPDDDDDPVSNGGSKIIANPPKEVVDAAEVACASESKDTAKQGERPDCRSAFAYAFMNYKRFLDGDNKVDADYIVNVYCTGGGRDLATCQKGATQGAIRGEAVKGNVKEAAAPEDKKNEVSCDATLKSILSWIACPLIDMGVGFTDYAFQSFVRPMLEQVPISTDTDDGTYKAWSQFRLIANILLIGSLLAIVYSQAKGGK